MPSSIELVENTQPLETNNDNQLQQKLLLIENDHYLSKAFLLMAIKQITKLQK